MFNKAVEGLASQGWQKSVEGGIVSLGATCVYNGPNGIHCAWGWVDPNIPREYESAAVEELHDTGVGLAARLDDEGLDFAVKLQKCHDDSFSPSGMRTRLRDLADEYNLVIPDVLRV